MTDIIRESGDNAWLLSNAFVILTMQAGFGMLEAGMVSAKATSNILMKNLGDLCFGGMFWFISGYGIAYGEGNSVFGESEFLLIGHVDYPNWVFQFAFAATASTILSGAVAGRMRFMVYLALSSYVTGFAYPLAARWAWSSEGWLNKMGYFDFAGCGPIHCLGGVMGMVGTAWLGPRIGVYNDKGEYCPSRSSPVHCMFGTFILWYAWLAFDSGSTGGISEGNDVIAGLAALNTAVASGAATMATVTLSFLASGRKTVDVFETTAGSLAGLVSITSACAVVEPWQAAIIGLIGGLCAYKSPKIPVYFKMDDPVGVFPVHVIGAYVGLIAVGIFSNDGGLWNGGGFHLLGIQVLGCVVFTAYGVLASLLFCFVCSKVTHLRVERKGELMGLDEFEHDIVTMKLTGLFGFDASGQVTNRKTSMTRVTEEEVFYTKNEVRTAKSMHDFKGGSSKFNPDDEDVKGVIVKAATGGSRVQVAPAKKYTVMEPPAPLDSDASDEEITVVHTVTLPGTVSDDRSPASSAVQPASGPTAPGRTVPAST